MPYFEVTVGGFLRPNMLHGLKPHDIVHGNVGGKPIEVVLITHDQLTIDEVVRNLGSGAVLFDRERDGRRAIVYLDEEKTSRSFLDQRAMAPGPLQDLYEGVYERARVQAGDRQEASTIRELINQIFDGGLSEPY